MPSALLIGLCRRGREVACGVAVLVEPGITRSMALYGQHCLYSSAQAGANERASARKLLFYFPSIPIFLSWLYAMTRSFYLERPYVVTSTRPKTIATVISLTCLLTCTALAANNCPIFLPICWCSALPSTIFRN